MVNICINYTLEPTIYLTLDKKDEHKDTHILIIILIYINEC